MVNDDRKQERRRTSKLRFYYTLLEKAGHPLRIDWQQFWTKKPESVPGFQPGLSMQNAIALRLVPPPLPTILAQASTPHPYRPRLYLNKGLWEDDKEPTSFHSELNWLSTSYQDKFPWMYTWYLCHVCRFDQHSRVTFLLFQYFKYLMAATRMVVESLPEGF